MARSTCSRLSQPRVDSGHAALTEHLDQAVASIAQGRRYVLGGIAFGEAL